MLPKFKQVFRVWIGRHPVLFRTIYAWRNQYRNLCVNSTTELVIEGFPRSANTFSVVAFQEAQPRSVAIAHHLHMPAQIILAARNRIPTIVLIRDPLEAVASLLVWQPELDAKRCLIEYISFYESITEFADKFVVGEFAEVTTKYWQVIKRLNQKFNTSYELFKHSENSESEVFARIDGINEQVNRRSIYGSPRTQKMKALESLKSDELRPLIKHATDLYKRFVGLP